MATFNKRGYKAPNEKEVKLDNNFIEDVSVDEKNSTTAKAFDTLDQTASKAEDFVQKNQKTILGVLAVVAICTVGYLLAQKFYFEPNQLEAADQLFEAEQNFQKAVDATDKKADSLYTLVLKGAAGKPGVLKVAEDYSGTDAGNRANYYAGIAYLNTKKYAEAINSLEKFKANDIMLNALTFGAIGDAYAQQNKQNEALEHYLKAADANKNDFTRPRYLLKAGKTALALGKKADALKYFTEIKETYDATPEAQQIDALIALAQ